MSFAPFEQLYWSQNVMQQSLISQVTFPQKWVSLLSDHFLSSLPHILCLQGFYHLVYWFLPHILCLQCFYHLAYCFLPVYLLALWSIYCLCPSLYVPILLNKKEYEWVNHPPASASLVHKPFSPKTSTPQILSPLHSPDPQCSRCLRSSSEIPPVQRHLCNFLKFCFVFKSVKETGS